MMLSKWSTLVLLLIATTLAHKNNYYPCPTECTCDSLKDRTDCSYNDLTALPAPIFPEVRDLDLSHNEFTSVPANISAFGKLEVLSLRNNRISALGKDSLAGLQMLLQLDLSDNAFIQWSDINSELLKPVPALQRLFFSGNVQLGELPSLTSQSLLELEASGCAFNTLRADLNQALPSLVKLDLSNNNIMQLHLVSDSLEYLNVANNTLRFIPQNSLKTPALKKLILRENSKLTYEVSLTSLEYLDISSCNLQTIPHRSMPNLKSINLSKNHIREIGANSFVNMPELTGIDLTYNSVERVDVDSFQNLTSVERIDLSFNIIRKINANTFAPTINLRELLISHNYLDELPALAVEQLRLLDVSECEINSVNKDSLTRMPRLMNLNLSRNVFNSIPDHFRSNSLNALDLSLCRIQSIKNTTFQDLNNLRYLSLQGNRLVEMKVANLHYISNVRISDNSWRCECDSQSFRQLYLHLSSIESDVEQTTCQTPEKYEGRVWRNACERQWFGINRSEPWMYTILFLGLFVFAFTVMYCINRARRRKMEQEQEERERTRAENNETMRRLRAAETENEESINYNAPDPRASENPPSYNEALSMPRLADSVDNLSTSSRSKRSRERTKKKRRRSKLSSSDDQHSTTGNTDNNKSDNESAVVTVEADS